MLIASLPAIFGGQHANLVRQSFYHTIYYAKWSEVGLRKSDIPHVFVFLFSHLNVNIILGNVNDTQGLNCKNLETCCH